LVACEFESSSEVLQKRKKGITKVITKKRCCNRTVNIFKLRRH